MKLFYRILFLFFLFFQTNIVLSAEVRFPKEELEYESVLPVFEGNRKVTMNRRVQMKYKINFMSSFSYRADEPFYRRLAFFGGMGFTWSEMHGVQVLAIYFQPGLSPTGESLRRVQSATNLEIQRGFDASLAPHPQYAVFLDYMMIPLYGKLSFSKNIVANFNISVLAGGGGVALAQYLSSNQTDIGQATWAPAIHLGVNQKTFIGKRLYLHGGLDIVGYYGSDPVNKNIANNPQSIGAEKFSKTSIVRIFVQGGIGVLIL